MGESLGALREQPLLFSDAMVRAILHRGKRQTRRLVKAERKLGHRSGRMLPLMPGDRLWVREAWYYDPRRMAFAYRADREDPKRPPAELLGVKARWQPSIFMPRQACRIELVLVDVRVESLMDLTDQDAIEEGIYPEIGGWTWDGLHAFETPRLAYRDLWNRINPQALWESHPMVRAFTFEQLGGDDA